MKLGRLNKIEGHSVTKIRVGSGMDSFIIPVCSCGWAGMEHYAYCNYQHSNFYDDVDRHFEKVKEEANERNNWNTQ